VFFNLSFEADPFSTILIAHRTSGNDFCVGAVTDMEVVNDQEADRRKSGLTT